MTDTSDGRLPEKNDSSHGEEIEHNRDDAADAAGQEGASAEPEEPLDAADPAEAPQAPPAPDAQLPGEQHDESFADQPVASRRRPDPADRRGGRVIPGPWAGIPGPSKPGAGRPAGQSDDALAGIEEFELRSPEDVQHCYRHPDRETGVACSNCGRPICWECMTPAPVGFRCPECMGKVRSERRQAPVVTRGQMRARWQGQSGSPATRALVIVNVAIFILELLFGGLGGGLFAGGIGGKIVSYGALVPALVVENHEYWRLVTSMFLHYSILHILFNMWALWVAGTYLEQAIGTKRFLLVYFISGLAGSAMVMLFSSPLAGTLGASGAIFGIFSALFVLTLHAHDVQTAMLRSSLGFIIAINLLFTFVAGGISWQAHIGGLIGGVVVMEAMLQFGRRRLTRTINGQDVGYSLAVLAVVLAVIVVRVVTFPAVF